MLTLAWRAFRARAGSPCLRSEGDQPTIGLILCKAKDKLDVEYAMRDIQKPMGVSSYITRDIPLEVRAQLPTVAEIEQELQNAEASGMLPADGESSACRRHECRIRTNKCRISAG